MLHEITNAIAHPNHSVTITWADGLRGVVDFMPFIQRGALFATLQEPDFFVREMRVLPNGIGLTWPDEVDFSADALRLDACPCGPADEPDQPTRATPGAKRSRRHRAAVR